MKRKLLKQMRNERRSNIWLIVELALVSSVLWFVVASVAPQLVARTRSVGADAEGVYKLELTTVGPDSPFFRAPAPGDSAASSGAESMEILGALRMLPQVEAVTVGTAHVYSSSASMAQVFPADTTLVIPMAKMTYIWKVAPDYFNVFPTSGIRGETPAQLGDVLGSGRVLLSENITAFEPDGNGNPADLYNLDVMLKDVDAVYTVGAVLHPLRRYETETNSPSAIVIPTTARALLDTENRWERGYIFVRRRPEVSDADFRTMMGDFNIRLQNSGNTYISRLSSMKELRHNAQQYDDVSLRNSLVVMAMLLVTVFLGILGTFWFRTHARVKELAVRKVVGAPARTIVSRLLAEGVALLVVSTPLALVIDWLLLNNDLSATARVWPWKVGSWFFLEAAVAFILLAITIILGIWFPARRAIRVDPTVTLRSE